MLDENFLRLDRVAAHQHLGSVNQLQERARLHKIYASKHNITLASSPLDSSAPPPIDQISLKYLGVTLIFLGLLLMIGAFFFSVGVSVETPDPTTGISLTSQLANSDLVAKRSMIAQAGGFTFIAGSIFLAAAFIREEIGGLKGRP